MKLIVNTSFCFLLGLNMVFAQECLDIDFKLRGYFYAGTSQDDSKALGGFYEDENIPKPLTEDLKRLTNNNGKAHFLVFSDSLIQLSEEVSGFKVFLINRADSVVEFQAQDSRLNIVRQVFYENEWRDIEYLPNSWCGNSYHSVAIKSDEYWEFQVPCFQGKIPATFRFVLRESNGTTITSNEFRGSFNKRQLIKEQGHEAIDIMDPYDN